MRRQGLQHGIQVGGLRQACALLQCLHLALHLQRGIHHHRHFGEAVFQNVRQCRLLLAEGGLFAPSPSVQANQLHQHQPQQTTPNAVPFGAMPQAAPSLLQPALAAQAAVLRPLALGQIPFRRCRLQPALLRGLKLGRLFAPAVGVFGHRGLGPHGGMGDGGDAGSSRGLGRQTPHRVGLRKQGLQLAVVVQQMQSRRIAGLQFRHQALHPHASGLQRGQGLAQPAFGTGQHQHLATLAQGFARSRRQHQMHVLRVLQQLLFQQAFQHRVASLTDTGRQVHGMPRQHLPRHHGHHLAAAVRQLWGRGLATARHTQAIGADHKLKRGAV